MGCVCSIGCLSAACNRVIITPLRESRKREYLPPMSMVESPSSVAIVPNSRIRIVLLEDHAILRDGLKALIEIEPEFAVVGEFGAVDECLAAIDELQPDLVLTDLELPQRSGIELLAR